MYSTVDICNLALSRLGDKNTVESLDKPTKQAERVFAKWYDITRRATLRRMMPSFAIRRKLWAKSAEKPEFGYSNAYEYRQDCVKVLGIGNRDNPVTDYAVEGGFVLTNEDFQTGLPVRYIADVKDISKYSENFIELFSLFLAYNVAPELTESTARIKWLESAIAMKTMEIMGIDSQENKPIIIKRGRLQEARLGGTYGVRRK